MLVVFSERRDLPGLDLPSSISTANVLGKLGNLHQERVEHGRSRRRNRARRGSAGSAPASWAAGCASTCMTKGYTATVYNRSKDKAQPLLDAGRRLGRHAQGRSPSSPTSSSPSSASPRTCARCSSATTAPWPAARPGTVLVDMTTSEPSLAERDLRGRQGEGRPRARRPGLRRRRRGQERRPVDHDRRRQGGRRRRHAAASSAWARRSSTRAAAGAGQHTKMVNQILIAVEHDRRLRGPALRLQGGARPGDGASSRSSVGAAGSKVAGRARPAHHRRATSSRASTSSTSSRTWASPWTRPKRMNLCLPGLALAKQLYEARAGPGLRPQGDAGADAGAGAHLQRQTLTEIGEPEA